MTLAEQIAALGTGSVMLPVLQIKVRVKLPRSRELARAGLLPLRLTTLDDKQLDEDEIQEFLEASERTMRRLVCECSLEPRIVNREPKDNTQIKYDTLVDDDVLAIYKRIMELAQAAYFRAEPATESKAQNDSMKLVAVHAKKWGLDPTAVLDWEPARFDELMQFSALLDVAIREAEESGD